MNHESYIGLAAKCITANLGGLSMNTLDGDKLRNARKKRGLSQDDLMGRANELLAAGDKMTSKAISSWERQGKKTRIYDSSMPRVEAIADVLGCDVDALLVDPDDHILITQHDDAFRHLAEYGFAPGFIQFLARSLGCVSIETFRVQYCRRLGVAWVDNPIEDFSDDDVRYSHDAVTGRVRLAGPEVEPLRGYPDAFDYENDSREPGAILHYAGKRKDQYVALSDLLQLQNVMGSYARFSMSEILNKAE